MLHAMRKGAGGWLAKSLLVLLVASFALWGIGSDMLGSSVGSNVIEVGDRTVSLGEFQREYRKQVNRFSQMTGQSLSAEQAKQYGVPQITIQTIKTEMLELEQAGKLNLGATQDDILRAIRSSDSFKNSEGQFDRQRFQTLLMQNGYSEAEFVEFSRRALLRQQLMGSIAMPEAFAPDVLVTSLFGHFGEKRGAAYVEILDDTVTDVPAPTDEQLTSYIEENPQAFTAPEYRKAVFLVLQPADLVDKVDVTEEQVASEFEGRASEFNVPEHRAIHQMIFQTEEEAGKALERIRNGEDFADVALDELQLSPEDIDLGNVSKADLWGDLKETVFAVDKGAVTDPVKTDLGWHVVKVVDVVPPARQNLNDVHDMLRRDIALRGAAELLYERATDLQDAFAGGATVEEAARNVGTAVRTLDWIDQKGSDITGKDVTGLPEFPEFLSSLFTIDPDAATDLQESADGMYFAIDVTEVKPSAVRPLEAVREQAVAAWQAEWRHEKVREKAEALLAELKEGATFGSLSTSEVSERRTTPLQLRTARNDILTPQATETLFSIDEDAYAMAENATGNGYLLFHVNERAPADKTVDKQLLETVRNQVASSLQQDLGGQYLVHLENKFGVSVKENLIRDYF